MGRCICPGCREMVEQDAVLKNYRKITDVLYMADCYCSKCGAFLCCSIPLGPEDVPDDIKATIDRQFEAETCRFLRR